MTISCGVGVSTATRSRKPGGTLLSGAWGSGTIAVRASVEVIGWPFWKTRPRRSVKRHVSPSGDISHRSASRGSGRPSLPSVTRRSSAKKPTRISRARSPSSRERGSL